MSEGSPADGKVDHLRQIIRDCGSILVAYSGSAASALVAAIARQELGFRAVLACIGVSPSLRTSDLDNAIELATKMGVRCRLVETQELLDQRYTANPSNRCYYCKSELYHRLRDLAVAEGWAVVANGTCADSDDRHRHGIAAARQHAVRSPLAESGMSKRDVLDAIRMLGLPVQDRPGMSCLSSRVRQGVPISAELLREIESAEIDLVRATQGELVQLRVRTPV